MKMLTIEMPDGSRWGVPVEVIARSRALNVELEGWLGMLRSTGKKDEK